MFLDRVRMRTEGLYVSRNTYIKAGMTDLTTENVNPVHMVCYYRYFRFFGTGEFYCKTSPHKLESVAKTFRDRRASAVDPNMYYGWYSIADVDGEEGPDESRLHLECAPVERLTGDGRASSSLHMWLRLRSTHPGGSNRLDFVKLASVDEAEPVRRSQHSSSSSASAETSSANLLVSATLCVDRLSDSMPTMPRLVRCSILFGASMRFATISESTAHGPSWSCSDLERMNE